MILSHARLPVPTRPRFFSQCVNERRNYTAGTRECDNPGHVVGQLTCKAAAQKKPSPLKTFLLVPVVAGLAICCLAIVAIGISGNKQKPAPTQTPKPSTGATVVISIPAETAGPTPTTAPTIAPTAELGKTRDKPLPRNSVVEIGDNMQVMITNVQRPANDIVAQGNMFNDTPVPGLEEYMIVKLHVECKKSSNEKCSFDHTNFKAVGADGKVRDQAFAAGVP